MHTFKKYFAILGREPELSLAELIAVAERDGWGVRQWQVSASAAVWASRELNLHELMAKLGGTVKLGEVVGRLPVGAADREVVEMLGRVIEMHTTPRPSSERRGLGTRLRFGVSAYDFHREDSTTPGPSLERRGGPSRDSERVGMRSFRERLRKIALGWKKEQREQGRSVRFVDTPDPVLSSVSVVRNRLVGFNGSKSPLSLSVDRKRLPFPPLEKGGDTGGKFPLASPLEKGGDGGVETGVEVVVLVGEQELLFGRTVAVQGFAEYSARDYGRPERDDRSGMLPPKLAQIMLNLTGVTAANATVLDPFCGSGTVLQEALLLGWGQALGSDLSGKAVSDAQANLKWLERQQSALVGRWEVRAGDARKLAQVWPEQQVDAIVTEPYLGPPEGPGRGRRQASQSEGGIAKGLVELYRQAFQQFARALRPGGVVIMVLPVRQGRYLPIEEIVDMNQWGQIPLPPIVPSINGNSMRLLHFAKGGRTPPAPFSEKGGAQRQTLLYGRPGQAVWREIGVWRRRPLIPPTDLSMYAR